MHFFRLEWHKVYLFMKIDQLKIKCTYFDWHEISIEFKKNPDNLHLYLKNDRFSPVVN